MDNNCSLKYIFFKYIKNNIFNVNILKQFKNIKIINFKLKKLKF
jgi:hypothetical protein